ncbi:MAG: hypothetical protein PHX72_03275 [Candidatus Shapirobacteria bacterium]|nr:hypothetical protein [Candidatus Shapirobacteria bacterium]
MKRGFVKILLLVLLAVVSLSFAYYYGTQREKSDGFPVPQITERPTEPEQTSSPTSFPTIIPISNIPSGWKTYTNQEFGFEISYPPSYEALDDQNNLYGWPNGIVLIYGGGQSYDLAIEHWNTQSEYENKYKNQTNITVKKIGNSYITLLNTNFQTEVDQIIETFNELSFNQ